MKTILIVILLGSFQLSASVWQRVDGPFKNLSVHNIFNFEDDIYITNKQIGTFRLNNNSWEKLDIGKLNEFEFIYSIYQKDSTVLLTSKSGIYRSTNNGNKWEKVENLSGFNKLESVVIIDEGIFAQKGYFSSSLYKLNKNSTKWVKVSDIENGFDSIYADRLIYDGKNLYAGDLDYNNYHGTEGGILKSTDKGMTWHKLNSFSNKVNSIISHNNYLIVAANDNHIYRSSDEGLTWKVDTSIYIPIKKLVSDGKNLYASSNSVSNNLKDSIGIYISDDNGKSWKKRNNGIYRLSIDDIYLFNEKLFAITDFSELYYSSDKSQNWNPLNPQDDSIIVSKILIYRDTLFSTSDNNGISFSTDSGVSWSIFSKSLSSLKSITSNIHRNENLFIAQNQWGVSFYLSEDNGSSWREETTGIFLSNSWMSDILLLDKSIVVGSQTEIARISNDNGKNWKFFSNSIIDTSLRFFKFLKSNEKVYALSESKIFESSNYGIDWNFTESSKLINTFNIVTENNIFYFLDDENSLFFSTNVGKTWTPINITDENEIHYSKLFVFNGIIILTSKLGITLSRNSGESWENYFLENVNQNNLFIDLVIHNNFLIAGTLNGVWRAKLSDLGIIKTSVESEIERNYLYTYPPYPNPAKSEVKVLFYWDENLPMTTDDISIYDITGKKIDAIGNISLVKQESHYGNLIWDCSSAQPGIYLINIKYGTEEKSVKVVVE